MRSRMKVRAEARAAYPPASRRVGTGHWVAALVTFLACSGLGLAGLGYSTNSSPSPLHQRTAPVAPMATDTCRALPSFLANLAVDNRSQLMLATDQTERGLVVLAGMQRYQHPSWQAAGFLGPLAYDQRGHIYVAPVPRVSLADNPLAGATTIWRVESQSGEMQPWVQLPGAANERNPYGVLGLSYACGLDLIFAGHVIGSTPHQEYGGVVAITPDGTVRVPTLTNIDVIGVLVVQTATGHELYAGLARSPVVIAVPLEPDGTTSGPVRVLLDLTLAGATPNERARKLRLVGNELRVDLVPFNFSLQTGADGQSRARQTTWVYDLANQQWRVERMAGNPSR